LNNKALTWDILQKISFEGPGRCCLCKIDSRNKLPFDFVLQLHQRGMDGSKQSHRVEKPGMVLQLRRLLKDGAQTMKLCSKPSLLLLLGEYG
jgi:hypothetical protein